MVFSKITGATLYIIIIIIIWQSMKHFYKHSVVLFRVDQLLVYINLCTTVFLNFIWFETEAHFFWTLFKMRKLRENVLPWGYEKQTKT